MDPNTVERIFRPTLDALIATHYDEVQRSEDIALSHPVFGEVWEGAGKSCRTCTRILLATGALDENWKEMKKEVKPNEEKSSTIGLPYSGPGEDNV